MLANENAGPPIAWKRAPIVLSKRLALGLAVHEKQQSNAAYLAGMHERCRAHLRILKLPRCRKRLKPHSNLLHCYNLGSYCVLSLPQACILVQSEKKEVDRPPQRYCGTETSGGKRFWNVARLRASEGRGVGFVWSALHNS